MFLLSNSNIKAVIVSIFFDVFLAINILLYGTKQKLGL
jgi:hypothetical protein